MSNDAQVTWLTQEAHDRLQNELDELSTTGRVEIAARIEEAREEGDLKENAGYHAAKDEQGKMEARIRQLTQILQNAKVGEAPQSSGVVETGTVVTAKVAGAESKFLFGSREMAEGTDLRVYSEQSAMGEAIMGLKVGDTATYTAPNGKDVKVEIVDVETFRG